MCFVKTKAFVGLMFAGFFLAFSGVSLSYAQPLTFTDQLGRTIHFDETPKRIATIATPSGSMVVTIDESGDRLVATVPNSKNAIMEGILHEYFPSLQRASSNIIDNNGSANIEELLNLETDLVLQWARHDKSIAAMEAAGLTVAAMKYSKLDIAKTWLKDVSIILDKQSKASEVFAWHDRAYKRITDKTKTIPDHEKPTVVYLLNESRAAGPESHFQFFMDTAGAKNVMTRGKFVDVDAEMLLNADPDIIWLFGFNMKMTPEKIYANPRFADLAAVKNRRVYKVPVGGDRWDPPNQESPLGWEWFTRTVHPGLLEGSMRQSVREGITFLYGKAPTEAQLDRMLRAQMNKDARDYEKIIK